VSVELKDILFSYKQPNFRERIKTLRLELLRAARFGGFDKESERNRNEVLQIIREVDRPTDGEVDEAVSKFTFRYDKVNLKPDEFKILPEDLEKAHREINKDLLDSIRQAINNVRIYQEEVFVGRDKKCSGATEIRYTPVEKVGICVPGASAPLPSTVIMTAVPAQVAGVMEIVVVSPPRYNRTVHPVTLAVCRELGIEQVYRIGGVQAIAALASEKGTIPKVDKIVGPGNQWVQTAKQMVLGCVGIDSVAGPSEVLIIANDDARAAWVAADMLSQAEHNPASAVVFTDSQNFGERVFDELNKQVKHLSRSNETIKCLNEYGGIFIFENMADVIAQADNFAPEHLEIQCGKESREIADEIKNAGAVFIGQYSPVAVGDYWAGPSHTLPTGNSAKFFSALSANDFIKSTSIIEYDKQKLSESAADIIRLAQAEGLDAHAKSISIRNGSNANMK